MITATTLLKALDRITNTPTRYEMKCAALGMDEYLRFGTNPHTNSLVKTVATLAAGKHCARGHLNAYCPDGKPVSVSPSQLVYDQLCALEAAIVKHGQARTMFSDDAISDLLHACLRASALVAEMLEENDYAINDSLSDIIFRVLTKVEICGAYALICPEWACKSNTIAVVVAMLWLFSYLLSDYAYLDQVATSDGSSLSSSNFYDRAEEYASYLTHL